MCIFKNTSFTVCKQTAPRDKNFISLLRLCKQEPQLLHFAELLDIALGIRWSLIAGTVVASVVRSFSLWLATDSPEEIYVLWMPNRWVPFYHQHHHHPHPHTRQLQVLINVCLCQGGSKWKASKIINDLISFLVKLLLKKYPQLNVENVFTGESHKVDVRDSYPRCQRLAQERSIEWDGYVKAMKMVSVRRWAWRATCKATLKRCSRVQLQLGFHYPWLHILNRLFLEPVLFALVQLPKWQPHRNFTCKKSFGKLTLSSCTLMLVRFI